MSRKPNGPDDLAKDGPAGIDRRPMAPAASLSMTTSPAFDMWLDRQMKTLLAACDQAPDQRLIDLIRREFVKRDGKITD